MKSDKKIIFKKTSKKITHYVSNIDFNKGPIILNCYEKCDNFKQINLLNDICLLCIWCIIKLRKKKKITLTLSYSGYII